MQVDYLLIGQGICGTWLSYYLKKAGKRFLVIDQPQPHTPSKVAAGIINPVTGRRLVQTWKIETVLPHAVNAYQTLGKELNIDAIQSKNILDYFTTPQMETAFAKRWAEDPTYLAYPETTEQWKNQMNYEHGVGMIHPCYYVDLSTIIKAWSRQLIISGELIQTTFKPASLQILQDGIQYEDIRAKKIIYCDGNASTRNPLFNTLPFAPNKGEALWVRIPDLAPDYIYKKGFNLVPWEEDVFWVGSTYEWKFEHENPTEAFREKHLQLLRQFLKIPFQLLDHKAAVRPATLERRPFVGFHPLHPQVGIFNGMGTKGCSLAPYFAHQWIAQWEGVGPLDPEADIHRFQQILSRGPLN